jgi:hypothetical protein
MSTNLEKLSQAGIVGTPHTISPDDESSINQLSDSEVEALIAIKVKLSGNSGNLNASSAPKPTNTISF